MIPNTSPISSPSIKDDFDSFLKDQGFTHFVTLAFNDYTKSDYSRSKVKTFQARLDRKFLGSRWYKKPLSERVFFVGFPEHMSSNFHYHLLMRVNPDHGNDLSKTIDEIWKSLVGTGSTNVQPVYSDGAHTYCLKEQWKDENFGSFIISSEFQTS